MNNPRRLIQISSQINKSIIFNASKPSKSYSHLSYVTSKKFSIAQKLPQNARYQSSDKTTNGSVDMGEMERFEKLAKLWWIENGSYEPLHRLNSLRVPLIRDTLASNRTPEHDKDIINKSDLIGQPLLGLNILDVGCGGGILSEALARLGANVTGVDACKENIISAQIRSESQYVKTKAPFYERLRYINCTLESLAEVEDNHQYFDAVVMSEVVEHVNNLEVFLSDSTVLLKNHGFSFVTTLNRTTQSYLLGILAAENVLGLVPKGTHTWEKFVKPIEVQQILEKNEVFVKFTTGMGYNPIGKKWYWQDDTSINYAMYAQKQIHD